MVGVCGVGMAGVARLLKARGFTVTGCDAHLNRLADWLKANGIRVSEGHHPGHLSRKPDWIVRTPAVAEDNPEIVKARKFRIPMFFRGEVLPELLTDRTSVAVCGTHGKTTTTTFITQLLRTAGRDPSWCIGGDNPVLGGVAGVGKGDVIAVEADESDGTLAFYHPDIAVVTNIEFDHMEHFASVRAFEDCFRTFIGNTRRRVVYGAEDPRARALCGKHPLAVSFGLCAGADIRGSALKLTDASLSFALHVAGRRRGRIDLPVPGRHNALNALAAIAVGLELGLSLDVIRRALRAVSLPRRRFERIVERDGIQVISDYAHHPSEIRALVQAALKLKHKRLLAVYQPHRYTRTLALGPDFPAAFEGLDELVLCPVYAASEKPLRGGTIWDLYGRFRMRDPGYRMRDTGKTIPDVVVATSLEQAWGYFRHKLKKGDVFLVVGAGDVEKIAGWARQEMLSECSVMRRRGPAALHSNPLACLDVSWRAVGLHRRVQSLARFAEAIAGKTTLRVGGSADLWAEVETVKDLARLRQWASTNDVPFHLLGAGSNVLVSDLGVRGVVARLTGKDFKTIQEEKGGIRVGAGVPLARLVDWMEQRGEGGYEFLAGIPGTVGGAVRMNAGAWGQEIGAKILSVRCLNRNGSLCVIAGKKLGFRYRGCDGLRDRVVVDVLLAKGKAVGSKVVRARRLDIAAKRKWWRGLRCAGSIFKNPPGRSAGRLIEEAGFKGKRVGGASVSKRHANVIFTDQGALASDVRCLIETIRSEVQRREGIQLETEVVFLE